MLFRSEIAFRKDDVGVIAQEVQEVLPEVVEQRKDETLAVNYEKLVPLLIEAIKEQGEQINTLKAMIKDMQNDDN